MSTFRYRAATSAGAVRTGTIEAANARSAYAQLRLSGLTPIEAEQVASPAEGAPAKGAKPSGRFRTTLTRTVGELAVLLGAGLTLDRALGIVTENIPKPADRAVFEALHRRVKEGVPLSRAMADGAPAFPPMAWAMAEAGEANGRLDQSLAKLAETMERGDALRSTIVSAMVYPIMLLVIATGVIAVMLFFVVPQFEGLFGDAGDKLPASTKLVVGVSHASRDYGLYFLLALFLAGAVVWRWLKQPGVRLAADRAVLKTPLLGPLVQGAETARFSRVLGSLVDGGVPLPDALGIARRSLANTHMASAVGRVAAGLKEGGGLSGPLAAAGVFPRLAMSFLRTGEETARLGLMLGRLADVLDRDVRVAVTRLIGILTPAITVVMGAIVAGVIASIMTAILGFNDLALTS